MTVVGWRIDRKLHYTSVKCHPSPALRDFFDGFGSSKYGGRWNHPGTPLVYISNSLSLAALEVFVHLTPLGKNISHLYFRFDIPSSVNIEDVKISSLPSNWRDEPPPPISTKDIGSEWARSKRTSVLRVPSVIVPSEYNYLLNPTHRDFPRIVISDPVDFSFDPRMWKSRG